MHSSGSRTGYIGVGGFVRASRPRHSVVTRSWRRDLLQGVVAVSGIGLVVAVYLGYVELAVIHALCPVCFSTYLMDGVVFLLSLWLLLSGRGADANDEDDPPKPDSSVPGASPTP